MAKINYAIALIAAISMIAITGMPRPSFAGGSAVLFLSPGAASVRIGEEFTVTVMVEAPERINAGSAVLIWPEELLTLQRISKAGILTLWVQEPQAAAGTVTFAGGLPSPGYRGSAGKVLSATFKARASGVARLEFQEASVLADDGFGTEVLDKARGGIYNISQQAVPSLNQTGPKVQQPQPFYQTFKDKISQIFRKLAPLPKPIILSYPKTLREGAALELSGGGAQDALVVVKIVAAGTTVTETYVAADAQGHWLYQYPEGLRRGAYTVSVWAEDSRGRKSGAVQLPVRVLPFARFYQKTLAPLAIVGIFMPYLFLIRRRKRKK